jgi:hypothetical protein
MRIASRSRIWVDGHLALNANIAVSLVWVACGRPAVTVPANHGFKGTEMHALGIAVTVFGAGLLVAMNVVHVRRYGRFVKYLELHHHEHWKLIGSPRQFDDEPQYGSVGYAPYFARRCYAELGDPELAMLGDKAHGMRKWMYLSLFVLAVGGSIVNGDIR